MERRGGLGVKLRQVSSAKLSFAHARECIFRTTFVELQVHGVILRRPAPCIIRLGNCQSRKQCSICRMDNSPSRTLKAGELDTLDYFEPSELADDIADLGSHVDHTGHV